MRIIPQSLFKPIVGYEPPLKSLCMRSSECLSHKCKAQQFEFVVRELIFNLYEMKALRSVNISADFRKFQWVQAPIPSYSKWNSFSSFLSSLLPSPLFHFPLRPSFSLFPSLLCSILSLEVGSLKIQQGVLRECCRLRHRVRVEPGRHRILLHYHCAQWKPLFWSRISVLFMGTKKWNLTTKSQAYMLQTQSKKFQNHITYRPIHWVTVTLYITVYVKLCIVVGFCASIVLILISTDQSNQIK